VICMAGSRWSRQGCSATRRPPAGRQAGGHQRIGRRATPHGQHLR
jgi:hypothetical protein